MKIKYDFITNSSSTSFLITNLSKTVKTLEDFVNENPQLLEAFKLKYQVKDDDYTIKNMLQNAKERNIIFPPLEIKQCTFGDEEGDILGAVYDYMLRDGGKSKSFHWMLHGYNR